MSSLLYQNRECTKATFRDNAEKFQASLAAETEKHLHRVFNPEQDDGGSLVSRYSRCKP
jgi:hypothetical protein